MPDLDDPEIYQTVLDGLETGVYIVDRNRRIRFWNEGAEQITGYLRQDVVGRFLRDHLLTTGDNVKDFDSDPDNPINLVFRDGKSSILEVSILHRMDTGFPSFSEPTPFAIAAARSSGQRRALKGIVRPRIGLAAKRGLPILA